MSVFVCIQECQPVCICVNMLVSVCIKIYLCKHDYFQTSEFLYLYIIHKYKNVKVYVLCLYKHFVYMFMNGHVCMSNVIILVLDIEQL